MAATVWKGVAFRGAPFEDWLMAEREGLRELALEAVGHFLLPS